MLAVGPAKLGVRAYIAAAGGIEVNPILGSRSTDLLTGLGPAPLGIGDRLALGDAESQRSGRGLLRHEPIEAVTTLGVVEGPRADRFEDGAFGALVDGEWTVSPRSNRIGVRLEGPGLSQRGGLPELKSEGIVTGAIQVPPDGQPIVMLADHPVTGGYPILAVIASEDVWLAGQLRPGAKVSFRRAA